MVCIPWEYVVAGIPNKCIGVGCHRDLRGFAKYPRPKAPETCDEDPAELAAAKHCICMACEEVMEAGQYHGTVSLLCPH